MKEKTWKKNQYSLVFVVLFNLKQSFKIAFLGFSFFDFLFFFLFSCLIYPLG